MKPAPVIAWHMIEPTTRVLDEMAHQLKLARQMDIAISHWVLTIGAYDLFQSEIMDRVQAHAFYGTPAVTKTWGGGEWSADFMGHSVYVDHNRLYDVALYGPEEPR